MGTVLAGLKTLGEKSNCLILCAMLEHNIAEVENEIFLYIVKIGASGNEPGLTYN